MASSSITDFYALEELLTPEEIRVRESVRAFVEREFLPRIRAHHRAGTFPIEVVPGLARLGVFGAHLSGHGCAGMGATAAGLIMQELERGDSGLRSFASVQSSLSMTAIDAFGSEAQRERWLPALARGEKFACFGLTEPDFGSNPAGMRTRARRDGSGWRLNGTKMWITNGTLADVAIVWAKADGDDAKSIRGFLVEKGTAGFSAKDIEGKFSMRASITSELALDEVRVPDDAILPKGVGLKAPLACLDVARYGIAWGAVGAALACFEEARAYAAERILFDRPLGGFQLAQEKLVWMLSEITKAQLLAFRLGRIREAGGATPQQISLAKMNNVSCALECARRARDLLGANGIVDEYQTIRHLLNLETVRTYEGTHDIHLLILGQHITGQAAFH